MATAAAVGGGDGGRGALARGQPGRLPGRGRAPRARAFALDQGPGATPARSSAGAPEVHGPGLSTDVGSGQRGATWTRGGEWVTRRRPCPPPRVPWSPSTPAGTRAHSVRPRPHNAPTDISAQSPGPRSGTRSYYLVIGTRSVLEETRSQTGNLFLKCVSHL